MQMSEKREAPDLFMQKEIARLKEANLDWKVHELDGPSQSKTIVDGKKSIVLCSNNYLGLANHPKLKEAAVRAIEEYGAGSGSVRVIAGTMKIHIELERILSEYKGVPDSIVFQSGFAANSGCIQQLVEEGDLIVSDELNHGSIIDGCRLTSAKRVVFKHKDIEDLERVLDQNASSAGRILVITDGVFSMDGDIAPLDKITKVAKNYGAMVYVDDAHGDGVLGENGRGIVNHFKLEGKVDIEMGTFSKAFGVVGGYVAGSHILKEYLMNKVRPYLLSGSHPPAVIGACIAAIRLVQSDPSIVQRLWENTRYFKKGLKDAGFDIGHSETPITPIMCGESSIAQNLAQLAFVGGVFVLPIVFPMVAKGKARIRAIVTSSHSKEELDTALDVFEKGGKKLGLI
jgi:glycine C-acetyltransferase